MSTDSIIQRMSRATRGLPVRDRGWLVDTLTRWPFNLKARWWQGDKRHRTPLLFGSGGPVWPWFWDTRCDMWVAFEARK